MRYDSTQSVEREKRPFQEERSAQLLRRSCGLPSDKCKTALTDRRLVDFHTGTYLFFVLCPVKLANFGPAQFLKGAVIVHTAQEKARDGKKWQEKIEKDVL